MSREYVLFELACVEGWAYVAWAQESRPGVDRVSDGYVAQEWQKYL